MSTESMGLLLKLRTTAHRAWRWAANAAIDRKYGSVLALQRRGSMRLVGPSNSDYRVLAQIFAGRITPDDVLVDIGCSNGRVLNFWLHQGCTNRIIGLELDEALADKVRRRLADHPNVCIVTGDAIAELPEDGTLFYMFNPFGKTSVAALRDRLASLPNGDRPVRLIYYNCKHIDVFEGDAAWEIEDVTLSGTGNAVPSSLAVITRRRASRW